MLFFARSGRINYADDPRHNPDESNNHVDLYRPRDLVTDMRHDEDEQSHQGQNHQDHSLDGLVRIDVYCDGRKCRVQASRIADGMNGEGDSLPGFQRFNPSLPTSVSASILSGYSAIIDSYLQASSSLSPLNPRFTR